jgi:hypothetical protein
LVALGECAVEKCVGHLGRRIGGVGAQLRFGQEAGNVALRRREVRRIGFLDGHAAQDLERHHGVDRLDGRCVKQVRSALAFELQPRLLQEGAVRYARFHADPS